MFAKQRYSGDLGLIGVYDSKILQEAVFYGLPTYRMTEDGGEGESIAPLLSSEDAEVEEQEAEEETATESFSVDPETRRVETDRGSYWQVLGQHPQVTHFRPVEPRLTLDVTADDSLPVHGAVIEDLGSDDITGVDPLYSRPTIDLTANEPEREAESLAFPAQLQSVNLMKAPNGLRDRLVLMAGQTFVTEGEPTRQRLFDHMAGTVYRSASDDWTPPRIVEVEGLVVDGVVVFSTSTDVADVQRGVILYRDDAGPEWQRAELDRLSDGEWSAGVPLRAGATTVSEFFVQLVDEAGNVAVSSNKGRRFTASMADPSDGEVSFELSSPRPDGGFYRESPDITITGLPEGEGAMVSVDGGEWFRYDGAFRVNGDGVHRVEALTDSGERAVGYVAIDSTPPSVTGVVDPPANSAGWRNEPVTVTWTCVDAVSGVASCPEPATVSGDGAGQTVTGEAVDRAGNSATATVREINIDSAAPSATIRPPRLPILHRDQRLTGTASDSLSGVTDVTVVYKPILLGKKETVSAKLSCSDAGRECEWSAAVPRAIGYYLAVAKVTDAADNRAVEAGSVLVRVVP